jgi:hypothetical protein
VQVGMACARAGDLDQNLAWSWLWNNRLDELCRLSPTRQS